MRDAAAVFLQRALELSPDMIDVSAQLGSLSEVLGDLDSAEACYRQLQTLIPNAPRVLARLATLLRGRLPESDEQRHRDLAQRPRPQRRGSNGSAIRSGTSCRRSKRVRQSCPLPRTGQCPGSLTRIASATGVTTHSSTADSSIGSSMRSRLSVFDRLAGAGDPTRQPIFVFGMPRSGTTLVEQILASHSRVHGAGELRLATADV